MNRVARSFVSLAAAVLLSAGVSAQLGERKLITLDLAKQMAAAAEKEIARNSFSMFVVIVDEGGLPLFVERVNDAQSGSFEVALAKARTAAMFRRPTKAFEDRIMAGGTPLLTVDPITGVEGGLPLVVDGKTIGAIGISGGTSAQDGIVAQAAVDALAAALKR